MNNTVQTPDKHENLVKLGATTIFALVVIGAGYAIYTQNQALNQATPPTAIQTMTTATPNAADKAAQGTPVPAQVSSPTDLTTAEQSLDSSDVDSISVDLGQNDSDLSSF